MRSTLFLAGLLLVCSIASSQSLDSLIAIQRAANPQEKIYVHFDKQVYNPGETIWFKAYLFTGAEPSLTSKNFYADLLDEAGKIISHHTAPIAFAGASGSFALDTGFKNSVVYFRAYTVSVLNGDSSFAYTKALRILPKKNAVTSPPPRGGGASLRFLPEGGNWVTGLPSNLAFVATTAQGKPAVVSGTIVDNAGTAVSSFTTLHNGMGSVLLLPAEGTTYAALWKDETGRQQRTPLPAPAPQGIVLRVTETADGNKRFVLQRSAGAPETAKRLKLVGLMHQMPVLSAAINLETKESAGGVLPVKNLMTGMLQLTVLDAANKPLAERIVFVNNRDYEFDGDVFLSQKNLAKRGLNQLEITVSDTLPANLSLAVTDADLDAANPMADNIVSRLLLTGELRGTITDPYYYFFSTGDSVAYHLDLVMLTHGWRRYNWDDVFAGRTTPPRWRENNYLSLEGKLTGLNPANISSDLQLTGILQTADSAKNFVVLPVDRQGRVFTDGLVFYDAAKLFFNFNKKTLSFDKSMLQVDNGLRKAPRYALPDTTLRTTLPALPPAVVAANGNANTLALRANRLAQDRAKLLENVTVSTRVKTAKEKMEARYVGPLFGGDGISFDLVNDPAPGGYLDIFQFLQGRVAGLQVSLAGGQPSLSWRGGTPALFLNEMQTDASMLQSVPVSDIAYIKILRPGSSMVLGGGSGAVAIYTRRGGDAPPDPNAKGLSAVQLQGYTPVKQFFSPDYATFSERDALDDVRTTLYWNPAIYVDKGRRRIRLKFYNNDITKRFRLVLEGLNTDGKLIHVEKEVGN